MRTYQWAAQVPSADVVDRDGARLVLRECAANGVEHEVGGVALRVELEKWQSQHKHSRARGEKFVK